MGTCFLAIKCEDKVELSPSLQVYIIYHVLRSIHQLLIPENFLYKETISVCVVFEYYTLNRYDASITLLLPDILITLQLCSCRTQ